MTFLLLLFIASIHVIFLHLVLYTVSYLREFDSCPLSESACILTSTPVLTCFIDDSLYLLHAIEQEIP